MSQKPVRLGAVGDVMLARDVGRHYIESPADFSMADVRQSVSDVDLLCANLECPVAVSGEPDPIQDRQVTFRADPTTLALLQALGVGVVSLGNNHMLDYGEAALVETLERLDAAGIRRVGAGRNYRDANEPAILDVGGRRIAFLSYAFIYSANTRMATSRRAGVSDHRIGRILPRIRELCRAGCDVVVMAHWGFEYRFFPLPYQMRLARRMIDEGACLVLGHGPHYPQGIEEYRGRDIVYSLGNFIFDEPHKFANRSFLYKVDLNEKGTLSHRVIVPVHLQRHVPKVLQGAPKARLESLIATLGVRYEQTDPSSWRALSAAYLTDICGRVVRTRSLKYLRVPTISFYRDVGPTALLKKLTLSNAVAATRSMGFR